MVFDLTGAGRTVLKANYGQYAWNPGAQGIASDRQPEQPRTGTVDTTWADTNGNLLYDAGEEGVLIAQRGGVATSFLDPNLKNTMTERSLGLARARADARRWPSQGGYVYRNDRQLPRAGQREPADVSAYNVPITIRDPGPDGVLGNADDGAGIPAST